MGACHSKQNLCDVTYKHGLDVIPYDILTVIASFLTLIDLDMGFSATCRSAHRASEFEWGELYVKRFKPVLEDLLTLNGMNTWLSQREQIKRIVGVPPCIVCGSGKHVTVMDGFGRWSHAKVVRKVKLRSSNTYPSKGVIVRITGWPEAFEFIPEDRVLEDAYFSSEQLFDCTGGENALTYRWDAVEKVVCMSRNDVILDDVVTGGIDVMDKAFVPGMLFYPTLCRSFVLYNRRRFDHSPLCAPDQFVQNMISRVNV